MPLRIEAIDRLFQRLGATYGRAWTAQWDGMPITDVKTVWSNELDVFGNSLHRIAWALENLPARCPNAIEFKALCRAAPAADVPQLPAPKADPERVKAELAKLGQMRQAQRATGLDSMKDWARSLVARHEAGEKVRSISLRFAREALGQKAEA